jgi:hypothetical protein
MRISELIRRLQQDEIDHGDIEVMLSVDGVQKTRDGSGQLNTTNIDTEFNDDEGTYLLVTAYFEDDE